MSNVININSKKKQLDERAQRFARIAASLRNINKLMDELRNVANRESNVKSRND